MADRYSADKGNTWWSDGGVIYPTLPNANGAPNSQSMTGNEIIKPPVVQPFVVVPYVSQMQPLYQYEYDNNGKVNADEEDFVEENSSKVSGYKIFGIIFSLLTIAVLIIGKFVTISYVSYLNIQGTDNGLNILMGAMTVIKEGVLMEKILVIGVAGVALCAVLVLLISLFTIKSKAKGLQIILRILQLLFSVAAGFAIMKMGSLSDIGYGLYALAGLALLSLIL